MNKTLVLIVIILVALWIYFRQNNQPNLLVNSENKEQITKLQQEVKHYQSLYQKRVQKDLEADQSQKIKELTTDYQKLQQNFKDYLEIVEKKERNWLDEKHKILKKTQSEEVNKEQLGLYQQKINELEKSLLTSAKNKLKEKKGIEKISEELETERKRNQESTKQVQQLQEKLTKTLKSLEDLNQQNKELLNQINSETKPKEENKRKVESSFTNLVNQLNRGKNYL